MSKNMGQMIRYTDKNSLIRLIKIDLCLLISCILLFSCAPTSARKQSNRSLRNGGGDDSVLIYMEEGLKDLYNGQLNESQKKFNYVTTSISGIWGDSPEAKRARSLWYEENVKPFKGEPYERMMAFYYAGILYLMNNDFGNAQAAFRISVMQDAFAEESQNRADVVAPIFLQGWALQSQGSVTSAKAAYDLVKEARPDMEIPSINEQPNGLIIAETGKAPRKVPDGVGSYQLKYFRGKKFSDKRVVLLIDRTKNVTMYPIEDVYWQAASRGGRAVDKMIEGKAAFRRTTSNIGTALTNIGNQYQLQGNLYGSQKMERMGDTLGLIGIGSLILSANSRPAVDTRYWRNLPDAIHVTTLNLEPGNHNIRFSFTNDRGIKVKEDKLVDLYIARNQKHPKVIWVSSWNKNICNTLAF